MNDESIIRAIVEQENKPQYLRTINGLFLAWPLSPPPHDFGEWSLVSLRSELVAGRVIDKVDFVKALSDDDIAYIQAQLKHWFGRTVSGESWALVQGVVDHEADVQFWSRSTARPAVPIDPLSRTGV